jgi:HEAT repeat protein
MTGVFRSRILLVATIVPALLLVSAAPALSQARSAAFEVQNANLINPQSAIRIAAIQALTRLEDDEEVVVAVPLIAERLKDNDPAVRIIAARELGYLGELATPAVAQIGQALADSEFTVTTIEGSVVFRSVGMAAAAALADLGPVASAALGDLLGALKSNDAGLRAAAARAIGFMGEAASQAAPVLVTALSDPAAETRFEAAFALGQIGPLSRTALAALQLSLADMSGFIKARSSGAEVVGSVRVAAAEALLNLGRSHLAIIKGHGGEIRQSDLEEPDLPWLSGRRLRLAADETDIRDLITVILRANQMTVSFRQDVEGVLTFNFVSMPMQGAFNMLLHDYNLSYEWDEGRRHVTILPYKSVVFTNAAALAAAPRPRSRPRRVEIRPEITAKLKIDPPRSVPKADNLKNSDNNQAQSTPRRMQTEQPAAAAIKIQPDSPTDISGEHKLSFIIKYDGLYRAMIDGKEYLAGMTLITSRGAMVIVDIRKRTVHLLRHSAQGIEEFLIQHRRRD